jgi:hypothetical protein
MKLFPSVRIGLVFLVCFTALFTRAQEPGAAGNFDGPAELPRVYIKSSVADTPAPGKVIRVKEDGNLQQAFDTAACGDTIELPAGASFPGHFRITKKDCDDAHWIIIRTADADKNLPPEGTRVSPCYAGVTSLPGRPDFHCDTPKQAMARIAFSGKGGSGPILFADGVNHLRFEGIEITRESPGAAVSALVGPQEGAAIDHIILDRVWAHGTAQDETTRGVYLTGARYVAVVDSYFSDFHCIARAGACTDSQAIAGGGGSHPMGPFKIVNNYLEASGENIIFGGSSATETPADIEIRRNHLFKPLIWMPGADGFVGGASGNAFIVKNLFEVKNAKRVLFEGNILENTWGGFSQTGFAILLTPKNQAIGKNNVCPLCQVTDITIRYNKVSHMGSGMQIANGLSDNGGAATAGERYSIHDVVFDDIDGQKYKGFGAFLVVLSQTPPLRDVKIDHITAFPPRVFMNIGIRNDVNKPANFALTNSIISAGEREITSAGGGPSNCAFQAPHRGPTEILKNCFTPVTFSKNAILGGGGGWPSGNAYPKDLDAVGFANPNNGKGGDYRLCRGKGEPASSCKAESKYVGAGSDGKDLGADVTAVDKATAGVL